MEDIYEVLHFNSSYRGSGTRLSDNIIRVNVGTKTNPAKIHFNSYISKLLYDNGYLFMEVIKNRNTGDLFFQFHKEEISKLRIRKSHSKENFVDLFNKQVCVFLKQYFEFNTDVFNLTISKNRSMNEDVMTFAISDGKFNNI